MQLSFLKKTKLKKDWRNTSSYVICHFFRGVCERNDSFTKRPPHILSFSHEGGAYTLSVSISSPSSFLPSLSQFHTFLCSLFNLSTPLSQLFIRTSQDWWNWKRPDLYYYFYYACVSSSFFLFLSSWSSFSGLLDEICLDRCCLICVRKSDYWNRRGRSERWGIVWILPLEWTVLSIRKTVRVSWFWSIYSFNLFWFLKRNFWPFVFVW